MAIDDRTANFDLPLPHPDNDPRNVDVPRLRTAIAAIDAAIAAAQADVDAAATPADIAAAIAALKDGVDPAYDTLLEIGAALSDQDDAVGALVTEIATKADAVATTAALAGKQALSEKDEPSGYAGLDADGQISAEHLRKSIGMTVALIGSR